MAISKRLRYEVLRRDGFRCRYCGSLAAESGEGLTVDHVLAVALGGGDEASNLVAACKDCNSGKSATPAGAALVSDVDQDAIRWARAMSKAAEDAVVAREDRGQIERAVIEILDDYTVPSYRGGGTYADYLPADFFVSIDQFLRSGLTSGEILDAVTIGANAFKIRPENVWRYTCGVCWKMIDQRHQVARAVVVAEDQLGDDVGIEVLSSQSRLAVRNYGLLSAVCDGLDA